MIRVFSVVLTIGFVLSIGCSSSVTVRTDYDPGKDFASYKTYKWYTGKQPDDELSKYPLTKKRIISSIDKALQAKEFELVESDEADFVVVIHGGSKERMQVTNWGGYGWYDPWWGPYGGRTDVSYYAEGTLVIDIVDTKEKELAWRGLGTTILQDRDAEGEQKFLDATCEKILKDFPPT